MVKDIFEIIKLIWENKEKISTLLTQIKDNKNYRQKRNIFIAFVDDRLDLTGYITSYGIIKNISYKDFVEKILIKKTNVNINSISELLKDSSVKYNIFDSGELNGYELDTPNLNEFDFIFKNNEIINKYKENK